METSTESGKKMNAAAPETRDWFGDYQEVQKSFLLKEQQKLDFYLSRQLTFSEAMKIVDRLNAFVPNHYWQQNFTSDPFQFDL